MSPADAFDILRSALEQAGIRYAIGGSWATLPRQRAPQLALPARSQLFTSSISICCAASFQIAGEM